MPVRPRSPAPYRGVEQLVARRAHNPEVGGSNPSPATIWTRVGVLNSFLRLSNTPTLIPWEKALVFQVFSFLLHSSVIHIAKIKDASLVVEK